jgi:hypothetical protein
LGGNTSPPKSQEKREEEEAVKCWYQVVVDFLGLAKRVQQLEIGQEGKEELEWNECYS